MDEKISALMDGELEGAAADEALALLRRDGEASDTWRLYHLMSDAMHEQPLLSAGFTRRMSERLAGEPTLISPGRLPGRTPVQRFAYAAAAVALPFQRIACVLCPRPAHARHCTGAGRR